jgi:hypothetical protein
VPVDRAFCVKEEPVLGGVAAAFPGGIPAPAFFPSYRSLFFILVFAGPGLSSEFSCLLVLALKPFLEQQRFSRVASTARMRRFLEPRRMAEPLPALPAESGREKASVPFGLKPWVFRWATECGKACSAVG